MSQENVEIVRRWFHASRGLDAMRGVPIAAASAK